MKLIVTNSKNALESELIDELIDAGFYRGIENFPQKDRRKARRRYVDKTIGELNKQVELHNIHNDKKGGNWTYFSHLSNSGIAQIIQSVEHAYRLKTDPRINEAQASLAVYLPEKGIYSFHKSDMMSIITDYIADSEREIRGIYNLMRETAQTALANQNHELVNFKNGILDRKTKRLMPHTHEIRFTSMNAVNYNPNATNKHFTDDSGEDWDVESWIAGLSDDPSVVNTLWEIIAACMRPGVSWNKTPWLYSTVGANGKGTFCELIRSIVGSDNTASLSVEDFGHNFMVSNILNTTCVVTDENPVGTIIDKVSAYKAAVTGDIFTIDRKYESPMSCTYNGIILQCMNSMPQVRDRSGSFYRRQLFIPMEKNFAGVDKPEIKSRFIHDTEVCEYVAKRAMDMQFNSFSSPQRCEDALEEYKITNDIAREFIYDIIPDIPWDFVPYNLIYDMYSKWARRYYPDQKQIGKRQFLADFMCALKELGGWVVPARNIMTYTKKFDMTLPCDPLYDLGVEDWVTKSIGGSPAQMMDKLKHLDPLCIKPRMGGIIRNPDEPSKLDNMVRDVDVDADDDEPIVYVDATTIKTDAHTLRDYQLDADDAISRIVAQQLIDEPDVLEVIYTMSANDVMPQLDVVARDPNIDEQLASFLSVCQANPLALIQSIEKLTGVDITPTVATPADATQALAVDKVASADASNASLSIIQTILQAEIAKALQGVTSTPGSK